MIVQILFSTEKVRNSCSVMAPLIISHKTKIVCSLIAPLVLGVLSNKQPSNSKSGSEQEMPKNMEPKEPDLSKVKDPKEPVQPPLPEPPELLGDKEVTLKSNRKGFEDSTRSGSVTKIRNASEKRNRNTRRKSGRKHGRVSVVGDEKLGIPYPGIPNASSKRLSTARGESEPEDEDPEDDDEHEERNRSPPENLREIDPIMREPKVPNSSIKEPKVKMSIKEPSMSINEPKPPPKMKEEPKLLNIPKIKEPREPASININDPDEPQIAANDRASSLLKSTDIGDIKEPMTSSKSSRSENSPRNADRDVPKILRNTDGNRNTPGSTVRSDPIDSISSERNAQNSAGANPTNREDSNISNKGSRRNLNLPVKVALNTQNRPGNPLMNSQNNPRNTAPSNVNAPGFSAINTKPSGIANLNVPNAAGSVNVNGPNVPSPGNLNSANVPRPGMTGPNAGTTANIKGPNPGGPSMLGNAGPANMNVPNALRSLVLTGPNAAKNLNVPGSPVALPVNDPRSPVAPGTPRIQALNSPSVSHSIVINDMPAPSQAVNQNVPETIFMNDWNAPSVPPALSSPNIQRPQVTNVPNVQFLVVPFSNAIPSEACSSSLSAALNDFAFALLKETKEDRNDMLISPLSIAVALTMTYHGSGSNTARQMEQVLGFQKHKLVGSSVTNGFVDILATLTDVTTDYKLLMSDDMFLQKNYAVSPRYIADLLAFFMASVQNVDFVNEGLSALNQINSWVSEKTQNNVPRLFKDPLGSPEMMLVSVVYFKGLWKTQFAKEKTREQEFNRPDGKARKVSMMTIENEIFRYLEDELTQYKFIDLPYRGEDISMLIALPRKVDSPAEFEMSTAMLCRVNASMKNMKLQEVVLPKFRIEYQLQLKESLQNLGISDLFDVNSANLTGISSQPGLYVGAVFHKAVLEVNEEGAKDLGPLKFGGGPFASPASSTMPKLPSFVANHPFLFYILDMRNGLVLFSGKVIDPIY